MVELDESRRYATNYFRLAADNLLLNKKLPKKEHDGSINLDQLDCSNQPTFHDKEIRQLLSVYEGKLIPQLIHQLNNGFNLLLYGFGSKLPLLECVSKQLDDCIFIDSYAPLVSINEVYVTLSSKGVDLKQACVTSTTAATMLIHGLDSFKLRNDLFYRNLASLAAKRMIRLIVTIEDPNFFLLLSPALTAQFNFVHHDCTTFINYGKNELESLPDLNSSKGLNKRSIKGALFVLQSLTSNARNVFKLLAEHQLSVQATDQADEGSDSEDDEDTCQHGLSQLELFKQAQNRFLISNEQSFKTILTEFLDHEIVKSAKSSINGGELLRVPYSAQNIKDILSLMFTM